MNDDETKGQEDNKTGIIDRANQAYRRAQGARKAYGTARHPIGSLNRFHGRFGSRHAPQGRPEADNEDATSDLSENKKKKSSPIDDINSVRKTVKTVKTIVNITRYIVNPWVAWTIVGVIIFIIIYMLFFGGGINIPLGGNDSSQPSQPSQNGPGSLPTIPGLSLSLNGPETINNGDLLRYTLSFSYNESEGKIPPDEIILSDELPENTTLESATPPYKKNGNSVEWKLSDILNLSPISITLRPERNDFFVTNKISARATNITIGTNLISDICTTTSSAGGYCSVDYLKKSFGNDINKATTASLICQLESGGDPFLINDNCSTNDYSVGLFQINLVAHCQGAYANLSCSNLIDENVRLTCSQQMLDPNQNIQKASSLSQNGTNWTAWSTWPEAQRRLSGCNNSSQI